VTSSPITRIERRDGRTIAYDDEGLCVFNLDGNVSDAAIHEVARLRERAFERGLRAGRADHARELRRLLDEGVEG
jgi:ribosomal protein L14